jgi:hypothetical protein
MVLLVPRALQGRMVRTAPPGRLVRLGRRVKTAPLALLDRMGLMVPRALLDLLAPRVTLVLLDRPVLREPPVPPVVEAQWA